MDTAITLRPVIESDFDRFDAALQSGDAAGTYQWFGFTNSLAYRRKFAENGLLSEDGGTFTVVRNDSVVGSVDWFKVRWGPEPSWCWTIGIGIYHDYRGQGIGTRAQQLVVDYLFRHTRAQRIQAYTDVENRAERRALEKAGFVQEGVLRSSQWRNGAWHDQVLYSILREAWRPA